jgi:hypothetical protein
MKYSECSSMIGLKSGFQGDTAAIRNKFDGIGKKIEQKNLPWNAEW